jgi:hypothetical protein
MRTSYFKTKDELFLAVDDARAKSDVPTFMQIGSFRCDCGESFACYLIDKESLDTMEAFVDCESCHEKYEQKN